MSEWIDWKGGGRPVGAGVLVDVKFGDGTKIDAQSALTWYWGELSTVNNIVAYRVSEQKSMEEAYDETTRGVVDSNYGNIQQTAYNSALDTQIGGDHYKKYGIQPITYIHANKIGFMEGNAIKYLSRWRDKGGVDDLKKAKHYIEMLIELEG